MQSSSIIRRWIRGSLLITVLVLAIAEGLFLYYSYNDLYGGVERAMESRFFHRRGPLAGHRHGGEHCDHCRKPRPGLAPRG